MGFLLLSNAIFYTLRGLLQGRLSGEVSEWPKEHAWKVCIRKRIEGSTPSLTANNCVLFPDGYRQTGKKKATLGTDLGTALGTESQKQPNKPVR